ncbi:MAG: histidine kinase, partial [Flavobacteriales bacterium]|nr:histidine kinase [Flavobacteriales bacterium]
MKSRNIKYTLSLVMMMSFLMSKGQIDLNCAHDTCLVLSYTKLSNRYKTINLDTSFHYASLSLKHARNYGDTGLLVNAINALAEVQFKRSEYAESIELSHELMEIYQKTEKWTEYHEMQMNMANIYSGIGENYKALEYLSKSIDFWKKEGDDIRLAQSYLTRSEIWRFINEIDSATVDIDHAISFFKNIDSLHGYYAIACNTKGNIYASVDQIDSAIKYVELSKVILDSLGNNYLKVTSLNNLARLNQKKGETEKAMLYYSETLKLARELKSNEILHLALGTLADFYFDQKKYQKAYDMLLEYDSVKNLVFNEKKEKQFLDIEAKYQAQQKQNEIEILEKKNEARELKIQQKNYTIWILSAIIMLLGLLLFLNVQRIRAKSEKNAKKLESEILRAQISPEFIKNSLSVIRRRFSQGKNEIANDYLADFATLMRRILDNSRKKEIPLSEELSNVALYLEFEKERFSQQLTFDIEVDEFNIDTSALIPPLIIQPMIERLV